MKNYLYVLLGTLIATTWAATASEHPIEVRAKYISPNCVVNLPESIEMGSIAIVNRGGISSFDEIQKQVTGTIMCPTAASVSIKLSNSISDDSFGVNFNTPKSNQGVTGFLMVTLDGKTVDFKLNGCNQTEQGCRPDYKTNSSWPVQLTAKLKHDRSKNVTPGDASFNTTMTLNYM